MAIEIVSFPSYKMAIFNSYVKLSEGILKKKKTCSNTHVV